MMRRSGWLRLILRRLLAFSSVVSVSCCLLASQPLPLIGHALALDQITPRMSRAQINATIARMLADTSVTTIDFAPGLYTLSGSSKTANRQNPAALIASGIARSVTIDGHGSALQIDAQDAPYPNTFEIENAAAGTKVTLKNFTVAYKYPPFTHATLQKVTACVSNAGGTASFVPQDVQNLHVPPWAGVDRIDLIDGKGFFVRNILYTGGGDNPRLPMSTRGATFTVHFSGAAHCNQLATMAAGSPYELFSNQFGSAGATNTVRNIEAYRVYDLALDNVRIVSAAGIGFEILGSHDVSLSSKSGCSPAPGEYRSSGAGCFAGVYVSGTLSTDSSVAMRGCGDDCLFALAYNTKVAAVASRTRITLAGLPNVGQGDTLQFVDTTGVLRGKAVISVLNGTQATLAGAGAPPGVAADWSTFDESQAPKLAIIRGGSYGGTPNRGIYVDALHTIIEGPNVTDTGSAGILVQYGGEGNLGMVPDTVSINAAHLANNNYAHGLGHGGVSAPAAIMVVGFAPNTLTMPAPAGQIRTVSITNIVSDKSGSSGILVASADRVVVTKPTIRNWYALKGAPGYMNLTHCLFHAAAVGFCNDKSIAFDTPLSPSVPNGAKLTDFFGVDKIEGSNEQRKRPMPPAH